MTANIASLTTSFSPAFASKSSQRSCSPLNLYLRLCCDRYHQTFVSRQYAAYPFRLSNVFRLDSPNSERAYLYIMNTSPGLLAGDKHHISIQLETNAKLYLTDQSATKVHSMPGSDTAQVSYTINVGAGAQLEFLPEPLILYANSRLEQITQVTLHPTGQLFLSELIVPGRLARNEIYQFHSYLSRLQVISPEGTLIFGDAMRLAGKSNRFKHHSLFAAQPVMANIVTVLPGIQLEELVVELDQVSLTDPSKFTAGHSFLPNCNGLLIRAVADNVNILKVYIQHALNCVRRINGQVPLPAIPK